MHLTGGEGHPVQFDRAVLDQRVIIVLAVVTAVRFRRTNPTLVWANMLIVVGVFSAASGGTGLAVGHVGTRRDVSSPLRSIWSLERWPLIDTS